MWASGVNAQVGVAVEFEDEDDEAGGEGDEVLDSDDEEMGEGEEEEGEGGAAGGGGGKAADLRTNMDVDDGEEATEEGLRVSRDQYTGPASAWDTRPPCLLARVCVCV